MWQKLVELWNRFTRESEEWEYFEYLQRNPDRTPFIEGKTKAKLAQELHDWKKLTHVQADEIINLKGQIHLQELFLEFMLREVEYYKKQHQLCKEKIKRSYKQVIR